MLGEGMSLQEALGEDWDQQNTGLHEITAKSVFLFQLSYFLNPSWDLWSLTMFYLGFLGVLAVCSIAFVSI